MKVTKGDEICGQEQAFKKWAAEVFHVSRLKTIYLNKVFILNFKRIAFRRKSFCTIDSVVCPHYIKLAAIPTVVAKKL